jgi:hypothetical protein
VLEAQKRRKGQKVACDKTTKETKAADKDNGFKYFLIVHSVPVVVVAVRTLSWEPNLVRQKKFPNMFSRTCTTYELGSSNKFF